MAATATINGWYMVDGGSFRSGGKYWLITSAKTPKGRWLAGVVG
jgi:hypothetical protein